MLENVSDVSSARLKHGTQHALESCAVCAFVCLCVCVKYAYFYCSLFFFILPFLFSLSKWTQTKRINWNNFIQYLAQSQYVCIPVRMICVYMYMHIRMQKYIYTHICICTYIDTTDQSFPSQRERERKNKNQHWMPGTLWKERCLHVPNNGVIIVK